VTHKINFCRVRHFKCTVSRDLPQSTIATPPPPLQPPKLDLSLSDLHGLEVCGELGAAELELLDNVGDLLEAVHVPVLVPLSVGYH
jgi:hypothetical protein